MTADRIHTIIFTVLFLGLSNICTAQSFGEEFTDSFFRSIFRRSDTTKIRQRNISEKYLPYRISPAQKKDYNHCLKSQKNYCALDTFSHTGFSLLTSFTGFMPLGKYKELSPGATFGLNIGFEYQPGIKLPMSLGINFLTMLPGKHRTSADIPFTIHGNNTPFPVNIPIYIFIRNGMLNMHGTMKWWIPTKYVQPFIQLSGGMLYASTNVRFLIPDNNTFYSWKANDEIYRTSVLSKVNWSAAAATGLSINIGYYLNLDLRATYLHSGKMTYYTKDQIKSWQFELMPDNQIENKPSDYLTSPIQNLSFSAGLHILFE